VPFCLPGAVVGLVGLSGEEAHAGVEPDGRVVVLVLAVAVVGGLVT
jgi:hypothetical protein